MEERVNQFGIISISNKTKQKNEFKIYTDNFDEFSFAEVKVEFEETFSISDITPKHLRHENLGPRNIKAYKKLGSKKSSTDVCFIILMGYARSPFQNFESYLTVLVGLN